MTSTDITTIAYNAVFTIGATGTGIWYVFKHGVQNVLRQEFQDIRDIKPVSYTHLTLPTNREV